MISRISDQPRVKSWCVQFKYLLLKVRDPDRLFNPMRVIVWSHFNLWTGNCSRKRRFPRRQRSKKPIGQEDWAGLDQSQGPVVPVAKSNTFRLSSPTLPHEWHTRVVVPVEWWSAPSFQISGTNFQLQIRCDACVRVIMSCRSQRPQSPEIDQNSQTWGVLQLSTEVKLSNWVRLENYTVIRSIFSSWEN